MNDRFTKTFPVLGWVSIAILLSSAIALFILVDNTLLHYLAFALLIALAVVPFIVPKDYKDSDTGMLYTKKEFYYPLSRKNELLKSLDSSPSTLVLGDHKSEGEGMRVDIYSSKKGNDRFCQIFEYVPYYYKACSQLTKL